jgi:hypothetical protein
MPVEEGKLDLDAQVPGLFNRPSGIVGWSMSSET